MSAHPVPDRRFRLVRGHGAHHAAPPSPRKPELTEAQKAERPAVEAAHQPPGPVCGRTHRLAERDRSGRCHERVEVPTAWDENRRPLRCEPGRCGRRRHVGPQPLSQVYAEELTDRA
nr:hypothetical protein StreXyl84_31280 [Streptomyces sp. Xyl84]